MKNTNMFKAIKKIAGITVIAAVVMFSMTACGDSPPGTTPSSQANPIALTSGVWSHGHLAEEGAAVWYSFYLTQGTQYYLHWNDSWQGNGSKSADIYVTAYFNDYIQDSFTGMDSGYTTSRPISSSTNSGTIKLRVYTYGTGSVSTTGSFAIGYTTGTNTLPN